jgi:hypothetical protein
MPSRSGKTAPQPGQISPSDDSSRPFIWSVQFVQHNAFVVTMSTFHLRSIGPLVITTSNRYCILRLALQGKTQVSSSETPHHIRPTGHKDERQPSVSTDGATSAVMPSKKAVTRAAMTSGAMR